MNGPAEDARKGNSGQRSLAGIQEKGEQGDALVGAALGLYYAFKEKNYVEAARWYRRSAEAGDAIAQLELGLLHERGKGAPKDYVEAHKWLNLAASRVGGSIRKPEADARDRVAARMTRAQIAEAERLAREWKPVSKDQA